jgi:hypothetical protein
MLTEAVSLPSPETAQIYPALIDQRQKIGDIMRKFAMLLTLTLAVLSSAGAVQASEICKAHDAAEWMSKDAITAKVTAMGYEVRKVQEEDGCWEVKGTKDGKRVEAYFDPVTAELVLTK